jgi:hypothetical protein
MSVATKLTHVSVEMRIRGDRLGTERVFRVNGIIKGSHGYEQATNIFHLDRRPYERSCRQERGSRKRS